MSSNNLPTVHTFAFPTSHTFVVRVADSGGYNVDSDGNVSEHNRLIELVGLIQSNGGQILPPGTQEDAIHLNHKVKVLMSEIADGRMAVPTRKEFAQAIGGTDATISNVIRSLKANGDEMVHRFEAVEAAHKEALVAQRELESQISKARKMTPEMLRAILAEMEGTNSAGDSADDSATVAA